MKARIRKKLELQALAVVTAAGFGCRPPFLLFSVPETALRRYAVFTVTAAELANRRGTLREHDLYRKAYQAGRLLGIVARRAGRLKTDSDHQKFVQKLYKNIGIELEGSLPGNFYVKRCFFSRYYSPEICRIMSNMDNGMVCGIFGRGSLSFNRRITEGNSCCCGCMICDGNQEEVLSNVCEAE